MPREIVTIECTEAKKEGKPVSRYQTTRNKKLQTDKVEKLSLIHISEPTRQP
jgi:large subunit ribosomal protein L33